MGKERFSHHPSELVMVMGSRGGLDVLRWHPRLGLRGAAGLVVLGLSLASALCLRASGVAPVRGGTYFWLSATLGGLLRVCADIRAAVFAVHASPLCGAAPTFLCRRKEK